MYEAIQISSFKAGADLTTYQYCGVYATTTAGEVTFRASQGGRIDGILLNAPDIGETAEVALVGCGGKCEVKVDEAVAAGAEITVAATGKGETAASADFVFGIALEASSADGDLVTVLFTGPYIKA